MISYEKLNYLTRFDQHTNPDWSWRSYISIYDNIFSTEWNNSNVEYAGLFMKGIPFTPSASLAEDAEIR